MPANSRVRRAADLSLVALAACAAILAAVGAASPLRVVIALLCAALLPGAAVLTRLDSEDLVTWIGLAVGISFGMEAVVASLTLWLEVWNPTATVTALGVLSALVLVDDARRQPRSDRHSRTAKAPR
jgi:hypothetical protein